MSAYATILTGIPLMPFYSQSFVYGIFFFSTLNIQNLYLQYFEFFIILWFGSFLSLTIVGLFWLLQFREPSFSVVYIFLILPSYKFFFVSLTHV